MTLHESFSIIDKTKEKSPIPESKGITLTTKLNKLSNKNKYLEIIQKINALLLGENVQLDNFNQDLVILSCFNYDQITSVNVKRLFSAFKNMLTDKRHSFTKEKLEMHRITHLNKSI